MFACSWAYIVSFTFLFAWIQYSTSFDTRFGGWCRVFILDKASIHLIHLIHICWVWVFFSFRLRSFEAPPLEMATRDLRLEYLTKDPVIFRWTGDFKEWRYFKMPKTRYFKNGVGGTRTRLCTVASPWVKGTAALRKLNRALRCCWAFLLRYGAISPRTSEVIAKH